MDEDDWPITFYMYCVPEPKKEMNIMKLRKSLVFVGIFVVSMTFLQLAYAAEPTFELGGYVRVDMTGESISNGSDVMV